MTSQQRVQKVKIPEFGVTIDLPDWYREAIRHAESMSKHRSAALIQKFVSHFTGSLPRAPALAYRQAQNELRRPPPSWPPQALVQIDISSHTHRQTEKCRGGGVVRFSLMSVPIYRTTESCMDQICGSGLGRLLGPVVVCLDMLLCH